MTTYTIYAESDGWLYSEDSSSPADAANGVGDTASDVNQGGGTLDVFSSLFPSGALCSEIFLSFDTSGVSGTVSSAALSLMPISPVVSDSADSVLEAYLRDWGGGTLTFGDWVATATIGGLTSAGTLAEAGQTGEVYSAFSGGSLGANINQSGSTRLMLVLDKTRMLAEEGATGQFYDRTTTGTTKDPKLVIETAGAAYSLTAAAGSYTVTGTAATLKRGRKVTADPGSYTVTGQAATFRRTYAIGAAIGSYSVGGQAVTLRLGRKVAIGAASYTVTGQSVSLILLGDTALLADSGAYTVTGQTAALRTTRIVAAGGGSYGIVGQPATLRVARLLSAANTSYAVTGADAALTYAPITPPDAPSTGGGGSSGRLERQKKARKRIKHLREVVEAARKAREEERAPAIADEVRQAAAEMELPAELGGVESLVDVMASVGRLSKALNEEIKRLQAEDRQQAAAQKAREREQARAQAEREEADEWDRLARILLLAS